MLTVEELITMVADQFGVSSFSFYSWGLHLYLLDNILLSVTGNYKGSRHVHYLCQRCVIWPQRE